MKSGAQHIYDHAKTVMSTKSNTPHAGGDDDDDDSSYNLYILWISLFVFLFLLFSTYLAWPFAHAENPMNAATRRWKTLVQFGRMANGPEQKFNQSILDPEIFVPFAAHVQCASACIRWCEPEHNPHHRHRNICVYLTGVDASTYARDLNEWIMYNDICGKNATIMPYYCVVNLHTMQLSIRFSAIKIQFSMIYLDDVRRVCEFGTFKC